MIEVGKTDLIGLEGKYRIIDLLDESPAGTIYLGLEREFSEQVVIKALPEAGEARAEFARRFSREAKILQTLNSPYVPRVRDWGADQGLIFIVTDHAPGKTLQRMLQESPDNRLDAPLAIDIAHKIGLALESLSAHGVVHRDLKPGNILLTRDGQIKLTNFGLAEHLDPDRLATGDSVTLAYLAPEQSEAGKPVDVRADLYSAGAVLYQMLAGRPPFEASSNIQLLMKVLTSEPPPLYRLRPDLPLAVHRFIEKALSKKPDDRYQTPQDFIAALDKIRLDEALPPAQPAPPQAAATEMRVPQQQVIRAILVSATNRHYQIAKARSIIGRRNRTTGETPDVDLNEEAEADTVSRKHVWLVRDSNGDGWFLEPYAGHKNIVKLNGQKIETASARLRDGDELQLGAVRLTFRTQ